MKHSLIKAWPITLIVLLAFILRINKLEELFHFTYDESVFAFVGRRLWLWHHIPLIGGVSPFGFHVAPYFYWFFALTLGIGKLNPLVWGYVAALIGALTSIAIFLVGRGVDSKKVGITASILWAFSQLANIYDRHFWGLTFGPLFSLLVIYCIYKIINGKEKFVYALGIILALIIHADLSYYMFPGLAFVAWIIFKIPVKRSTYIAIGIIALSFLPLVIFDIRHNFSNTRPVFAFINAGRNTPTFSTQKAIDNFLLFPRSFSRFVYPFSDNEITKQYSYCRIYVKEKLENIPWYIVLASLAMMVSFGYFTFKKPKNAGWKLVLLLILMYFVGIQLYGTILQADIFEHYLTGIFAFFILIFAKVVSLLPKKLWLVVLGIFVVVNLYKLSQAANSQGLSVKRQAIEYTMDQVGDKPFSLDSLSTCWKLNGYRYLFTVFGREPVKSYVDPNLAYLYGTTPVAQTHPPTVVVFVIHDFVPERVEFYRRYAFLKSHETKSAIFGMIEVIIIDNSSGWFDQS